MRSRSSSSCPSPSRAAASITARPTAASRSAWSRSTPRVVQVRARSPISSAARWRTGSCPPPRSRARAGGVTTVPSAVRTRRRGLRASPPSGSPSSPACARSGDHGARRPKRARTYPCRSGHDVGGRGRSGHREDDRARRPHGGRPHGRPRAPGRHGRGHLHGHRSGRAEAASPHPHRASPPRRRGLYPGGAPAPHRRAAAARGGTDRDDPLLLRRPAARAAGRGGRRPALRGGARRRRPHAPRPRLRPLVRSGARQSGTRRAAHPPPPHRRGRAARPAPRGGARARRATRLPDVVETYDELKKRAGCLDFLDLLLLARNLVRGKAAVRRELQRRFTHLFVDEFQDTDPLQAEILVLLAADDPMVDDWRRARPVPGKLFIVGDPKQSIYRFRRADVALYEEVKRRVVDAGGALVELTTSFRAVPEIQEAVNAAFAPRLDGGNQARYVPLAPFRSGVASQPAVVALPVPAPYGDFRTIVRWKIDACLPDAVAAFVEWLVRESGWTVTERERPGERVPLRARHVCLLFRRFRSYRTDVTHPYVRALEARHLPHLLVGGTSFHRREEVEAIRNALSAIERPEDELAVFATLRGPLFALGDAALLAFRERCRTLPSFRPLPADLPPELQEVADALAVLRDLHRGRNRRPISDTIGRLLAATRAPAGLAIWPTGAQAP